MGNCIGKHVMCGTKIEQAHSLNIGSVVSKPVLSKGKSAFLYLPYITVKEVSL
jgi:hypothetical protein